MTGVFTLANSLTFARLVLLPVVIAGVVFNRSGPDQAVNVGGWIAVAAMVVVWLTDLVDGRIARRLKQASPFGKSLDSTVDFVLIYCLFIAFYAAGRLATWQFGFLYLSMLTILTLQLFLNASPRAGEVASTNLGKLTGALQYVYLLFLVMREVLPASEGLESVHMVYFIVLAAVIVMNTVECVFAMAQLYRMPQE